MKRNIALLCSILGVGAISAQAQTAGGIAAGSGNAVSGLSSIRATNSATGTTRPSQGTVVQNHPNNQQLPPGLQGQLPPGLSRRDQLPPGLQRSGIVESLPSGSTGSLQPLPGTVGVGQQPLSTQFPVGSAVTNGVTGSGSQQAIASQPGSNNFGSSITTPGTGAMTTGVRPQVLGRTNTIYFGSNTNLTPTGRQQGLAPGQQRSGFQSPSVQNGQIRPQVLQTNGATSYQR